MLVKKKLREPSQAATLKLSVVEILGKSRSPIDLVHIGLPPLKGKIQRRHE
jgi:hypothetical protein